MCSMPRGSADSCGWMPEHKYNLQRSTNTTFREVHHMSHEHSMPCDDHREHDDDHDNDPSCHIMHYVAKKNRCLTSWTLRDALLRHEMLTKGSGQMKRGASGLLHSTTQLQSRATQQHVEGPLRPTERFRTICADISPFAAGAVQGLWKPTEGPFSSSSESERGS